MSDFTFREGGLDDPAVVDLLYQLSRPSHGGTPANTARTYAETFEALRVPEISFYSLWDGDKLAGIGALRWLDKGHAEISLMNTPFGPYYYEGRSPLLTLLIGAARARGHRRLSVRSRTGRTSNLSALYEAFGFIDCDAFGFYSPDPYHRPMSLTL